MEEMPMNQNLWSWFCDRDRKELGFVQEPSDQDKFPSERSLDILECGATRWKDKPRDQHWDDSEK